MKSQSDEFGVQRRFCKKCDRISWHEKVVRVENASLLHEIGELLSSILGKINLWQP